MKRLFCALLICSAPALADEGMWTFNNFPSAAVGKAYGFAPSQPWLDHVRLSSARLAGGCSGSFVSAEGLVMTNHHCAHQCIEQISTKERDRIADGFYAKAASDEVKCPEIEVNQLAEITDVTARVHEATKGLVAEKYAQALKGTLAKIEEDCAHGADDVRCDVVTLYRGGRYDLYKYRRFQDVRLVFAPEFGIAFFGGDPDNFNFPRYNLDVAFLRVYQNGAPAKMEHYLRWSPKGAQAGELTFTSGHPGRTDRLMTVNELELERDQVLPFKLIYGSQERGLLTEFSNRGAEQRRVATSTLFGVENSLKAWRGRRSALVDQAFFQKKVAQEADLKRRMAGKKTYSAVYGDVQKATQTLQGILVRYFMLEGEKLKALGFKGDLAGIARGLVRAAAERQKPNEQRLREYIDSGLPQQKQKILTTAPIHDELEIALLSFSLTKLREELGADDPSVKRILGAEAPEELARRVVTGTKLKDLAVRTKLYEGGAQAVDASTDPYLELAKKWDAEARPIRARYENEVDSAMKRSQELLAKARFEAYGTSQYPDATFTLRLSYGSVKGWEEPGRTVAPFTAIAGTYDRATGRFPFTLPKSWLDKKAELDQSVPFNVSTTNDIIGGNSGSPLINKDAEVVGIAFDGNIHSLGGAYGFDEAKNRTVSVTSTAIVEALEKIYRADRVLAELRGPRAAK